METFDLSAECTAWLAEVDRVMKRDWCIDTVDAGWSREDQLRYWQYGETAEAFVGWFAEKYGLIRFETRPSRRRPAKSRLQA
tara:strand:+ start:110 stop:355 length:246 start_codon:yes stop_codon:yes gene_type:complete